MRALTDTGRGYNLEALNIRSDHSSFFPSSILHFPLIAPPDLQLCQPFDHLLNHIGPPSIERALSRVIPTTRLLSIAYTTKHSILSLYFLHRGEQSGLVRVFLVQLGFLKLLYVSAQSWHNINIIKQNPTQGGCKVLALI
jgi:hypothetical protein